MTLRGITREIIALVVILLAAQSFSAQAQAVHEILSGIQERKLILAQRDSLWRELQKEAELAQNGSSNLESDPVEDFELVVWRHGLASFPSEGQVNSLSIPKLLEVLNQAVREVDFLKKHFYNVDTAQFNRQHEEFFPNLESIKSVGLIEIGNIHQKLKKLATQVERLRVLGWPSKYSSTVGSYRAYESIPGAAPGWKPGIPFMSGSAEDMSYSVSGMVGVDPGYSHFGVYSCNSSAYGWSFTDVECNGSAGGVKGISSRIATQENTGAPRVIESGKLHLYKRMSGSTYYLEAINNNYEKAPITRWQLLQSSSDTLSAGDMSAIIDNYDASFSDIDQANSSVLSLWDVQIQQWTGNWKTDYEMAHFTLWFQFDEHPTNEEYMGYGQVGVLARLLCEPEFTPLTGLENSELSTHVEKAPGEINIEIAADLLRIELGRGLYNRGESAALGSLIDGFGSPLFIGSMSGYKLIYESEPGNYPDCLVPQKYGYLRSAEFTSTEKDQTGWQSKKQYVASWYKPRLRQVYGTDAVVDIEYVNDYYKVVRFYWPSQVSIPANGHTTPQNIRGSAFKTIVLHNGTVNENAAFPTDKNKLRLIENGIHWEVSKVDSQSGVTHYVKKGSSAGAANYSYRVIQPNGPTNVTETISEDGINLTIDTHYYSDSNRVFNRFSRYPSPISVVIGNRSVNFTYGEYARPLNQYEQPVNDLAFRPILTGVSFSGDSSWNKNGSEINWSSDGARSVQKFTENGVLNTMSHQWNGATCESVFKLGNSPFKTIRTEFSDGLETIAVAVDNHEDTTYTFFSPNDPAPFAIKQILQSNGHRTSFTISPSTSETIIRIREGWGTAHASGTDTIVTTNTWGGLVSKIVGTSGGIALDSSLGSQHTGWGQPKRITGFHGEQLNLTFDESGHTWGMPTSWTTPTGVNGSIAGYDAFLRPTSIDNGFSTASFNFSTPLQPSASISGQGNITASLTAFGELTSLTDSRPGAASFNLSSGSLNIDGRQVALDVTDTREVLGKASGLGERGTVTSYSVEENKLCVTTTVRAQNNASHYTVKTFYDGYGRVVKITKPGANGNNTSETWAYNDAARSVTYTPPPGGMSKAVTSTLSANGAVLTVQESGGTAMRYTRSESSGNLILVTEQQDDSSGSLTWTTVSREEYNPTSGVSSYTPWGLSAAKITQTESAPSQTMTISTSGGSSGDTQSVTLTKGRPSAVSGTSNGIPYNLGTWTYQGERLTAVSGTVAGKGAGLEFDSQGRVARMYGPGYNKAYSYSGAPGYNVTVTDSSQGTSQTIGRNLVGDLTSLSGNVSQPISAVVSDETGGVTKSVLNGNLTVENNASGALTSKNYTGPPSISEIFSFDANGAPRSGGVGPTSATITYNNNIQTTQYSGGFTVAREYYDVGLLKRISGSGDDRSFTWLRGQLATEHYASGAWPNAEIVRSQDGRGRIDAIALNVGSGGNHSRGLGYDSNGRPASVASSGLLGMYTYYGDTGKKQDFIRGPLTTTWTYDDKGRVSDVTTTNTAGEDFSFSYGYNSRNLRTSRISGSGTSWGNLAYDSRGRFTGGELIKDGNVTPFSYGYDSRGNVLSGPAIAFGANSLDQSTGRSLSQRTYGVRGKVAPGATLKVFHPLALNGEVINAHEETGFYEKTWTVDNTFGGGGISHVELLVRGTLTGEGHNGSDAVADKELWVTLPAVSEVLEYDAAGRLDEDGRWTYQWNGATQLINIVRKAPTISEPGVTGEVLDFTYDLDGRRVSKTHNVLHANSSLTRVITSKMFWDGWLPVFEERTVNGQVSKRWFVWGRDASGSWDGAGGVGGLIAIHEEGGRTLLPVDDGLGNIVAVIDKDTGVTVARYEYSPYGQIISQSGEVDACPFRWQSKLYDAETGLYYFGYRYYDPKLCKWLSRDPLGEAGGFNLYAYCENDPVNNWDYLGMWPWGDTAERMMYIHELREAREKANIHAADNGLPGVDLAVMPWEVQPMTGIERGIAGTMGGLMTRSPQEQALTPSSPTGSGLKHTAQAVLTSVLLDTLHLSTMVSAHQPESLDTLQQYYWSNFTAGERDVANLISLGIQMFGPGVANSSAGAVRGTMAGARETVPLMLRGMKNPEFHPWNYRFRFDGLTTGGLPTGIKYVGPGSLVRRLANGLERRVLYHYTDEAGLAGILKSQELRPSLKALNPSDARYGNGQYLTDLVPGTKTPAQLSQVFVRRPFFGRRYTHYIEIDITGLNIIEGRPGVFVIPNETPLDLIGRILGHGTY